MSDMSKAQQWRIAASVLNLVREAQPSCTESNLRFRALKALNEIHKTAPWEYPWYEVVRSLRDRSEAALAKRLK